MKKLLALMLVVVTAFAFCACSRNEKTIKPIEKDSTSSVSSLSDSSIDSSDSTGKEAEKDTLTVVEFVKDGDDIEYIVDLSALENATAFDALNYVKTTYNVTFEYYDSTYMGKTSIFATSFGALKQDAESGTYLYFYTSVESDWEVGQYALEMTYKDTKLVSSGVGISEMKAEKDAIIYVGLISYS